MKPRYSPKPHIRSHVVFPLLTPPAWEGNKCSWRWAAHSWNCFCTGATDLAPLWLPPFPWRPSSQHKAWLGRSVGRCWALTMPSCSALRVADLFLNKAKGQHVLCLASNPLSKLLSTACCGRSEASLPGLSGSTSHLHMSFAPGSAAASFSKDTLAPDPWSCLETSQDQALQQDLLWLTTFPKNCLKAVLVNGSVVAFLSDTRTVPAKRVGARRAPSEGCTLDVCCPGLPAPPGSLDLGKCGRREQSPIQLFKVRAPLPAERFLWDMHCAFCSFP